MATTKITEYDRKAVDFATKHGFTFQREFIGHDFYFDDDENTRDVYRITLRAPGKPSVGIKNAFSFKFGQSLDRSAIHRQDTDGHGEKIVNKGPFWTKRVREIGKLDSWVKRGQKPNLYDALSCLHGYEPGTFTEWCSNFGYDTDSRKALAAYEREQKQWADLLAFAANFGKDFLEELAAIN